jgi:hypothetical protein
MRWVVGVTNVYAVFSNKCIAGVYDEDTGQIWALLKVEQNNFFEKNFNF